MAKILRKVAAAMLSTAIAIPSVGGMTAHAEGKTREVVIDGAKAISAENKLYRGAGMVTGNNSSRLLLDYKAENPKAYWEIMNYLFGEKGIGLTHIKIEMGSDINSSSGTEPTVKRTEDEKADVTRGAGYQLAADALTINRDITLDMLYWSEPLWVTNSQDVYAARYKWYKETLDAAYETYGLKFDYVSAVRNERAAEVEWIKYLSKALKAETDCPYDYSAIKIVGGDEVCTWSIAGRMLEDEELRNAIDVVGSHYTSWSNEQAQQLANEYGKELWFSEASSPMSYSQGTFRYDGNGSGMGDINGLLDIANRYITMFPGGMMTLCEYQPVISAYYDGVTYCQKQMITANTPWDGSYYLDGGYYMALHFSQFIDKGWQFVEDACYGDGKIGGDGHAIVDAVYSYVTCTDAETDDYTVVLTNTTAEPITYNFTVKNLDKAGTAVNVWETRGPDGDKWNENYFRNTGSVTPTENGGEYKYSVTIKPYSLVTLSTVERQQSDYEYTHATPAVLELPYSDDFSYEGYGEDYLSSRGNAPRYTTDEGGAFEVQNVNGNNVLMQMITPDIKATEWGATPSPTTNFGDDRWFNYSISADVGFEPSGNSAENYTGVGLRYILADSGISGYWLQLYEDGSWKFKRNKRIKLEGVIEGFDSTVAHNIRVEAVENTVKAYLDDVLLCEYNGDSEGDSMLSAGRAALYSSYNKNWFDNVQITPIDGESAYIQRFDNTDIMFGYTGDWTHKTMDSFKNYKRTISEGKSGAELTFDFSGTAFALTGVAKDSAVSVAIDGEVVAQEFAISDSRNREVLYHASGLADTAHTVTLTVLSGVISVDGAQVSDEPETVAQLTPTEKPAYTPETDVTSEDESISDNSSAETEDTDEDVASDIEGETKSVSALPFILGGAALAVVGAVAVIILTRKKK